LDDVFFSLTGGHIDVEDGEEGDRPAGGGVSGDGRGAGQSGNTGPVPEWDGHHHLEEVRS
jgi:hypothetical protein